MSEVRRLLARSVAPSDRPAVFISGGLDSTILLHHLCENYGGEVRTYTVGLPEDNEFSYASRVAEHYGTTHRNVVAENIMGEFEKVAPSLDKPRFNLWPLYLYREAKSDGCLNVYVGEGLDEHFGGYENKPPMSPQVSWGAVLEWSLPTHRQLAERFGLVLHTPFVDLPLGETIRWWRDPHRFGAKSVLKDAYRGLLPDYVVRRGKVGGRFNWEKPGVWGREFSLLGGVPVDHVEANRRVDRWIIQVWLEGQR